MTSPLCLHASAVAVAGKGALIVGPSGSGKSSLALQLMGYGATLVADDQTELRAQSDAVWLSAPPTIAGLIEARGVGLLRADAQSAPLHLVIDLSQMEDKRLPDLHMWSALGQSFPCLHKTDNPAWPAAILQYLTAGRRDPG